MAARESMILDTGRAYGLFTLTESFGKPIDDDEFVCTIATVKFCSTLEGWSAEMQRTSTGSYQLIVESPDGEKHTESNTYSYGLSDGDPIPMEDFHMVNYLGRQLVDTFAQLMTSGTTKAKMHNDAQEFIDNEGLKFSIS